MSFNSGQAAPSNSAIVNNTPAGTPTATPSKPKTALSSLLGSVVSAASSIPRAVGTLLSQPGHPLPGTSLMSDPTGRLLRRVACGTAL
jgi:hypothetical protein